MRCNSGPNFLVFADVNTKHITVSACACLGWRGNGGHLAGFTLIHRLHSNWRRHVRKAVVRAMSEGRKKTQEKWIRQRRADYVRRRGAGIEWTQMPLWHDTLSVCEKRGKKGNRRPRPGAGPLVCVGRRALSKQRTRNPCRAMRCRWLGRSVGHCNQVVEAFS